MLTNLAVQTSRLKVTDFVILLGRKSTMKDRKLINFNHSPSERQ